MRFTTYGIACVSLLLWSLPIGIFVGAMLIIYQRGFGTTVVEYVAPAFGRVLVLPAIGFLFSLIVPAMLRLLKYNRAVLTSAVFALAGGRSS